MNPVQQKIETIGSVHERMDQVRIIGLFLAELEKGAIRAAVRSEEGIWTAEKWIKEGILFAFKIGILNEYASGALSFLDKDTIPPRKFRKDEGVRLVPGGTAVRRGAHVAKGVVIMPPAYINVGAFVDEDTMIDSHALIGSCAQIGKRVHISAAAQIGGVLEPVGDLPVCIEDDVIVGGNCGVYEGTVVRPRAVIGAGTIITAATPVYDAVRQQVYRRTDARPLEIPYGAVVVPGSRPLASEFAKANGLHVATPVIVKYRDEKTDASTILEEALR